MNLTPSLLLILVVFVYTIQGLYEDQIGKFDWRLQYVGRVSHSLFDTSGKKIVVATEENVLAVLLAGTSRIEWRHILGTGPKNRINQLFLMDHHIVTVSGSSPATLRAFDLSTGILQWEFTLPAKEIQPITSLFGVSSKYVTAIDIQQTKSAGYELSVTQVDMVSGSEENPPAADLPWFNPIGTQCQLVYPHLACLEKDVLNVVDVRDPIKHQRIPLEEMSLRSALGIGSIKGFLWVKTADRFHVFRLTNDGVKPIARSPESTLLVDIPNVKEAEGQYISFLVANGPSDYLIRVLQVDSGTLLDNVGGSLKLAEDNGQPDLFSTYLTKKAGGDLSYRYAITTSDDALLYGSKKEIYWSREESLTSILQVEMVDLPVSETDASIEEEFGFDKEAIYGHAIRRLVSQFKQILIVARQVLTGENLLRSSDNSMSTQDLVRDRFGLHKLIIIVTKPGKIFAMDSLTGKIVWQRLLVNINTDKLRLYIQRTSIHYPLEPQCTILAKSSTHAGQSVLFVFHPITGQGNYVQLGYGVQQALLLPQNAETEYLKPLVLLDLESRPHVYPSSGTNQLVNLAGQLYLFTADPKTCLMRGYSLAKSTTEKLSATPIWQLQLCSSTDSSEEIVSLVGRHPEEKVFSQGRVLADRSVLYKYLNPNLVAVTTAGSNHPHHKGYLNLYLIDVVSGSVVFSVSHRRVQPPYHLVMAENWVVYSYYNAKYRRTEMGSLELFEGPTQLNSTAFSAFTAPQPHVDRQAYIYPAHITAMKDTFSEKGMTAKHVLIGLSNGWIQELPRVFLDPRRPVVAQATPEMREESIMPYLPELPIPSEAILNYNQTAFNIHSIYVAPSSLESTGLVFAYGLDIFFTHVTPSKTFDVLNDDFEYFFIALVCTGLTLASLITKRLASKKALRQAWK